MTSFLNSLSNLNGIDFKAPRDQLKMLEIFVICAGIVGHSFPDLSKLVRSEFLEFLEPIALDTLVVRSLRT